MSGAYRGVGSGHVHQWILISPHPLVAVLRYACTSCTAVREERRR